MLREHCFFIMWGTGKKHDSDLQQHPATYSVIAAELGRGTFEASSSLEGPSKGVHVCSGS